MITIEEIFKKLELEEMRLIKLGEAQEIAFQLAIASLTDDEVKLWHSYNIQQKFTTIC